MLTTLITIPTIFTVILVAHNYVLEAIHKDAIGRSTPRHKSAD